MTLIHQCDRCGYEGRVIELVDGYLCEGCDQQLDAQRLKEEACTECGQSGVTSTGLCYACENSTAC